MKTYIMTKRSNLGYLILKTPETKWEGIGSCCGWYSWCGYKKAKVIAKFFPEESKVKVVNEDKSLFEDVYDDFGSKTIEFEAKTRSEAVNKFIDFLEQEDFE